MLPGTATAQAGSKRAQWPRGSLAPYTKAWPEGPGQTEEAVEAACLATEPCTRCLLHAARSCLGWTRMVISFFFYKSRQNILRNCLFSML